jgi:hypothetical protein
MTQQVRILHEEERHDRSPVAVRELGRKMQWAGDATRMEQRGNIHLENLQGDRGIKLRYILWR